MREAIMSSQLSPGLPAGESPVSGFTPTINQKIPKKQSAVTILNYLGRGRNKIAVKGIMTQALVCGLSALIYGLLETFQMDIDCPPRALLHCGGVIVLWL